MLLSSHPVYLNFSNNNLAHSTAPASGHYFIDLGGTIGDSTIDNNFCPGSGTICLVSNGFVNLGTIQIGTIIVNGTTY
jgi:hypothetical protein